MLHGESPNVWHRQGTQKTGSTYNQHRRSSMGTTHRPSTRHHRKGSPRAKSRNINQHSSRARLHHSNLLPYLRTPSRNPARPSRPMQPYANHRRAEPQHNTHTTRTSGDQRRPPPRGPMIMHYQEVLMDSQGNTARLCGGEGGKGGI